MTGRLAAIAATPRPLIRSPAPMSIVMKASWPRCACRKATAWSSWELVL